MAVGGISGTTITGMLGSGSIVADQVQNKKETERFESLLAEMKANSAAKGNKSLGTGISSSNVIRGSRVNGDYTKGFSGTFTSEADRSAKPQGFAANARTGNGKIPVIDKTSELYEQSLELENYMVKMMLSSMRNTIQHTSLSGDNDYARKMYEDMMYDNYAESMTKNSNLGIADQIYIELSGQRN